MKLLLCYTVNGYGFVCFIILSIRQLHIFQWYAVNAPSKCFGWFVPSLLPSRGVLCFVAQHFVVTDVEMGAHSALLGAGKGKSKVCFVLGVKAVMSEGGFFPGKILPQSCTCLSKTVAAALAPCPSPQAAALHQGTELWTSGDLLSSLDWGTWKIRDNDLRKRMLALLCLGPVISIGKAFVKHFLCQLH